MILIFIAIGLALGFGFNWLLTKGIIWVMLELFKIDWTTKFWAVFLMLFIIETVLGCSRGKK